MTVHTFAAVTAGTGGVPRVVPEFCASLSANGVQAEIVTTSADAGNTSLNVAQTRVPGAAEGWGGFRITSQFKHVLAERCAQLHPDLVHGHGLWTHLNHVTSNFARGHKIPHVISPHGMLMPASLGFRNWKKRLALALYQWRDLHSAAVLHAASENEAADLRRLGLKMPIAIAPFGIQLPPRQSPHNGREPFTALFLSRLHPGKGLLDLIGAWALVRPNNWRLSIVGPDEGGHQAVVEAAVRAAGLEQLVSFLPGVNAVEKWAHYRAADLFILPTHSENFGMVIAEALASEIPVLTTRGAPWEKLLSNRCGWWTEIGAEPLAAALREATEASVAQRREMGARGRALVEREFDWKRVGSEMKTVYQWMLGGGPAPSNVLTL